MDPAFPGNTFVYIVKLFIYNNAVHYKCMYLYSIKCNTTL